MAPPYRPRGPYEGRSDLLVRSRICLTPAQRRRERQGPKLNRPNLAARFCRHLGDADQEVLVVLSLDAKSRLLSIFEAAIGGTRNVAAAMSHLVKVPVLTGAHKVILVHNHPSGEPAPSQSDRDFYAKTKAAFDLLGTRLVDSLVVADGGFYSLLLDRGGGWQKHPAILNEQYALPEKKQNPPHVSRRAITYRVREEDFGPGVRMITAEALQGDAIVGFAQGVVGTVSAIHAVDRMGSEERPWRTVRERAAGRSVAYFRIVRVGPRHRRRGIGRHLAARLVESFESHGASITWLAVVPQDDVDETALVNLYASLGFEPMPGEDLDLPETMWRVREEEGRRPNPPTLRSRALDHHNIERALDREGVSWAKITQAKLDVLHMVQQALRERGYFCDTSEAAEASGRRLLREPDADELSYADELQAELRRLSTEDIHEHNRRFDAGDRSPGQPEWRLRDVAAYALASARDEARAPGATHRPGSHNVADFLRSATAAIWLADGRPKGPGASREKSTQVARVFVQSINRRPSDDARTSHARRPNPPPLRSRARTLDGIARAVVEERVPPRTLFAAFAAVLELVIGVARERGAVECEPCEAALALLQRATRGETETEEDAAYRVEVTDELYVLHREPYTLRGLPEGAAGVAGVAYWACVPVPLAKGDVDRPRRKEWFGAAGTATHEVLRIARLTLVQFEGRPKGAHRTTSEPHTKVVQTFLQGLRRAP